MDDEKRGRGRPAKGAAKAGPINIKIPPELLAAIDERAETEGINRTQWILRSCRRELDRPPQAP